jgi:hypothetical protein
MMRWYHYGSGFQPSRLHHKTILDVYKVFEHIVEMSYVTVNVIIGVPLWPNTSSADDGGKLLWRT